MVLRPPTPPKFHPCQGSTQSNEPSAAGGSWARLVTWCPDESHQNFRNILTSHIDFYATGLAGSRSKVSLTGTYIETECVCLRWQKKENPLLNGSFPSKERKKNIESPYQTKRIRCLFHFGKIKVFHFFPSASFCHFSTIDCKQSLHYGQLQSCLSLCCLGKLKFCLLFVCSYCRECYSDFIICGIWSTSVEVSSVDYCLRLCPCFRGLISTATARSGRYLVVRVNHHWMFFAAG